jgi:predicted nuclease of predicted toxin-antitoxin system
MKVLLDECVTRKLRRDFQEHEVHTVEEAGLKGLKNGNLLRAAAGHYDVLVTVDQNLPYQQNIKSLNLAVLVLAARRNTYDALHPLMDEALESLKKIQPGEAVVIKAL